MEISQRHHSTRTRFLFRDDEVEHGVEDGSGSRTFSVPYTGISRDRETLTERNEWLRNVGAMWLALGVAFTAMSLGGERLQISIWLYAGIACLALYRLRSTHYTLIATDKGKLFVIDGEEGRRILSEIESRRVAALRREFDFFPPEDTSEQQRARFRWLHRQGALSETELQKRLQVVDAMEPRVLEFEAPAMRACLN